VIVLRAAYGAIEDSRRAARLRRLVPLTGLSGELEIMMLELQSTLYSEESVLPVFLNGTLTWIAVGIALVLAALIYLCRLRHQEGLLWLGIDAVLAALPVLLIGVSLKGAQIKALLTQQMGAPDIFDPVLHRLGNNTLIGGAVLLALAVGMIAGFVLLRDRRLKKEAAAAQLPEIL